MNSGPWGSVIALRMGAAVAVGLEAALLVTVGALYVAHAFSESSDPAFAAALGAVVLIFAAGLALCAWAVARGRHWSRAPVLTWQILQVAAALYAFSASPLAATGAVVLALCAAACVMVWARREPSW